VKQALAVTFQNVDFFYQSNIELFNGFSLTLQHNKTVLLMGENGVGKSTLANLAAGILLPIKGIVNYSTEHGQPVFKPELTEHLVHLGQNPAQQILGINPLEEIKLWFWTEKYLQKKQEEQAIKVLTQWHLAEKADCPVWELSAGELKSLALAGQTLFLDKYWILDEPLSDLDNMHTQILLSFLSRKRQINKGMLIISHRTDVFRGIADEILILQPNGKIGKRN
jgi:energy-coupling factor transporter ATP-binding protein EcfA2